MTRAKISLDCILKQENRCNKPLLPCLHFSGKNVNSTYALRVLFAYIPITLPCISWIRFPSRKMLGVNSYGQGVSS